MTGIIIKALSGFYYVESGDKIYECKARGSFRKSGVSPLVGDRVEFAPTENGKGVIDKILERKNSLIRPPVANIDKLFISARGLSYNEGLTDSTIDEGEAKQAMIAKSNEIITLVDHSKVSVVKLFQVIPSDEINVVIVDDYKEYTSEQLETIRQFKESLIDFRVV